MPVDRRIEVVNYQTALRQLMDKPFLLTQKYRAQQGRAVRTTAWRDPDTGVQPIVVFERALISDFRSRGIPMFAHCVVRTHAEQDELFEKGRSKARAGQSPHNYGMAVDLVHSKFAWKLDLKSWEIIGHIGYEVAGRLGIGIEWGGEWNFYDPAHWQLANWRELAAHKGLLSEGAVSS